MLENQDLKNVLVLDIETVPQFAAYDELPEDAKELWAHKMRNTISEDVTVEETYEKAGIYECSSGYDRLRRMAHEHVSDS